MGKFTAVFPEDPCPARPNTSRLESRDHCVFSELIQTKICMEEVSYVVACCHC